MINGFDFIRKIEGSVIYEQVGIIGFYNILPMNRYFNIDLVQYRICEIYCH